MKVSESLFSKCSGTVISDVLSDSCWTGGTCHFHNYPENIYSSFCDPPNSGGALPVI